MITYTIERALVKDRTQSPEWEVYFSSVKYEEGIRFLQNMDALNVVNVKFRMLKNYEDKPSLHADIDSVFASISNDIKEYDRKVDTLIAGATTLDM